jgi:hypothetical protein
METKGLLFIPDISGFTQFVNEMEIEHSRFILQNMLEVLIDANQLGLEISEIEGDAILFYRFGSAPEMKELYAQVQRMFCDFHRKLKEADPASRCQCVPCATAIEALSLKVVTHYGEFASYNVKNFSKLVGKDVIVAHQLLKNDIPEREYWLVTSSVLPEQTPAPFTEWMKWDRSAKRTENGEISFHYAPLMRLRETKEAQPRLRPVSGKVSPMRHRPGPRLD